MRRKTLATGLMLVALPVALGGTLWLPQSGDGGDGVWLLPIAAVFLLAAIVSQTDEPEPRPASRSLASPVSLLSLPPLSRLALLVTTAFFVLVAYLQLGGNKFTRTGTIAWLGAMLAFTVTVAEIPADWRRRLRFTWRWRYVTLIAIFLLAAFFRFYRLDAAPGEMGSDHAEKLLDVVNVLAGKRPIFFERNTGREAFQFYLSALLIRWTPLSVGHLALKVGTALAGLLAVPLTYLLARELYGRFVGLTTAALMAISHWHVAISRVGQRFPFTPLFVAPVLLFLFRAFRHNRRNDWLACGFFLGVGLHTYIPMRIVPLLLVVLVGVKALGDGWGYLRRRREEVQGIELIEKGKKEGWREASALQWAFWRNAVLGGVASVLVFLPLLRYMVDRPDMFWFRVMGRADAVVERSSGEVWDVFWQNTWDALRMFHIRGDEIGVSSVPLSPVLDDVTGALFWLGLIYLLWRLLRRQDRRSAYLLLSLWMLLLPSILSISYPGENPSVVRTGGAIPVVMAVAALPPWLLYRRLFWRHRQWRAAPVVAAVLAALLFGYAVRANFIWYFGDYAQQYHEWSPNTTELGAAARQFVQQGGDMDHVYHVPHPHWADTRNIGINAGYPRWNNAVPDLERALEAHTNNPAAKLYLVHITDTETIPRLQEAYPEGRVERYHSKRPFPDKDFWMFTVPKK